MSTPADPSSATLSAAAQAWLARLPAPIRPQGISMFAPGIADRLATSWDDLDAAADLLEELLVEGERALPHDIAVELLRLYEYHARCRASEGPSTTWELPASGLQDLPLGAATAARRA
jgi:hypothetical protein